MLFSSQRREEDALRIAPDLSLRLLQGRVKAIASSGN